MRRPMAAGRRETRAARLPTRFPPAEQKRRPPPVAGRSPRIEGTCFSRRGHGWTSRAGRGEQKRRGQRRQGTGAGNGDRVHGGYSARICSLPSASTGEQRSWMTYRRNHGVHASTLAECLQLLPKTGQPRGMEAEECRSIAPFATVGGPSPRCSAGSTEVLCSNRPG